jgi:DNA-binding CsgD family transcriptional regulator
VAAAVFGRENVLVAVDTALASAQRGLAALVLEGEPGIGKTTIWREGFARASAKGYRVLSCRAALAEARLSFAALGDLLAPLESSAFASLPDPQRRALEAALLRAESSNGTPDPRAIGTGIVSLVAQLAASRPVLIAIDDLQWLDLPSVRAIEFALRRLEPHQVVVLATVRVGERGAGSGLLAAISERVHHVRVGPLSLAALYRIIEHQLGLKLPRPLLVRIERACGGNPLYALEIVRALDAGTRASRDAELPIPDDLRALVGKRLKKLPRRTRDALLTASALAKPTTAQIAAADLGPAEEGGVVRICADGRIEFAHPLFAGAVYATASVERRRKLHEALAEIATDIEERGRHLMLAHGDDAAADARVADVLHDAAEHALRRGAIEVAADLDEESARRTPRQQEPLRFQRYLRSARHYLKAGDPARSKSLCEAVLDATPPGPIRVHALRLLAEGRMFDRPDSAIPLLEEAVACVGDDPAHAAQLEVSFGIVLLGVFKVAEAETHLIRAVELAERSGDRGLIAEAIALRALSALFAGKGVDQHSLNRALALEDIDREVPFQMRASFNVAQVCQYIGNLSVARDLLTSLRDRLIVRGEEVDLAWVLAQLASNDVLCGRLELAEQEATDAERVAVLTGVEVFRAFAMMIRAMARAIRGNSTGARADGTQVIAVAERIGWPHGANQSRHALAVLALSEADPETAATVLASVVTSVEATGVYEWPIAMMVPDAIEAFVATGDLERARRLTDAFAGWARTFDRPWALATSSRCRALLYAADGNLDDACAAAEKALVEHERLSMPFELGRTLLVLGRLQRRRGERRAARTTLEQALGVFDKLGAPLWAGVVAREIARIGVRRAPEVLTEGEKRVAALAAHGMTNPEIAARLFMSRRTVEANLARAYRKLGIRSRAELGAVMAKIPHI